MKLLKKLAIFAMALTLCTGVVTFAACGEDNTPAITAPTEDGYHFQVLDKDGKALNDEYAVQLCGNICIPLTLDANGCVSFLPSDVEILGGAGEYEIHVVKLADELDFEGPTTTPASFSKDRITLKLK